MMTGAAATGRDRDRVWFRWGAFAVVVLAFFLLCGELVLWARDFRHGTPLGPLQSMVVGTHAFLGFSSAIFALLLILLWSGRAFVSGLLPRAGIKVLGVCGVILSVSGLAGTVTYGQGETTAQVGGMIGTLVASRMVPLLGQSFCMGLFCLLMVGSLMLATNWLFLEEFKGLASLKTGKATEPVSFRLTSETHVNTPAQATQAEAETPRAYPLFQPEGEPSTTAVAAKTTGPVSVAEEAMITGLGESPEPPVVLPAAPPVVVEPEVFLEKPSRSAADSAPETAPMEDSLEVGRTFHTIAAEFADAQEEETPIAETPVVLPGPSDLAGREHRFDEDEEEEAHGQRLLWREEAEAETEAETEEVVDGSSEPAPAAVEAEEAETPVEEPAAAEPITEIPTPDPSAFTSAEPVTEIPTPDPADAEIVAEGAASTDKAVDEPSIAIPRHQDEAAAAGQEAVDPEALDEAARRIIASGRASLTLLQRSMKITSIQASQIMEALEERGLVGPYRGSLAREVLMTYEQWMEQGVGGLS